MDKFYNIIILGEQERHQAVIDHIMNNHGTTLAKMDRLEGQSRGNIPGHVKLSNIVKDLIDEGIIYVERSEGNNRDKPLYVNGNNPFVTTPREIDEFEELFTSFIHKIIKRQSSFIHLPSYTLDQRLQKYKEHLGEHNDENLTTRKLEELHLDVGLHTELEFLSVDVSPLIKAIQILSEFIRIYTIRSIVEWPIRISDKKALNKLVVLVQSKICKLQVQVMEIINPLLRTFYKDTKTLLQIAQDPIDPNELLDYYKYFDLDIEVKPVLKHLSKVTGTNPIKQDTVLPLEKRGVISPSEVGLNTLKELYDPEEYYEEQLGEEEWARLKQSMSE